LLEAMRDGAEAILDRAAIWTNRSCHLDALERVGNRGGLSRGNYEPVLFVPDERVTRTHRLRSAFQASVLAGIQESPVESGRIVHGRRFKVAKIRLAFLDVNLRVVLGEVQAILEGHPPPLRLTGIAPNANSGALVMRLRWKRTTSVSSADCP